LRGEIPAVFIGDKMKGLYDHIDFYTKIELSKISVYAKKMTVKMFINFYVNYRAWKLTGNLSALKEIIQENIIDWKKVNKKYYGIIIDKLSMKIDQNQEEKSSKKIEKNINWLSELIAFFSFYCGWKKEDVLNLYIDETKSLIENVNKLNVLVNNDNQDMDFLSNYYSYHKPDKYREEIVAKRQSEYFVNDDLNNLRKLNREFLKKSYGGEDAVS